VLVLDEADRMLDMGFRVPVERIVAQTARKRQTLLFSATLDGVVAEVGRSVTRDARRHTKKPATTEASIVHRFVAIEHDEKLDALAAELSADDRGRTLVFVRTKRGADRLVKRLRVRGHDALAIHGDKSQPQREKALQRFHRGHTDTLVATDVAARGIDISSVTHVINFDAPADRDTYVHRVGRTGRAGNTGTGVTFVMRDQAREVRRIAKELGLQFEAR